MAVNPKITAFRGTKEGIYIGSRSFSNLALTSLRNALAASVGQVIQFDVALAAAALIALLAFPALAELGTDNPTDDQLLTERLTEVGTSGSGIFDIQVPGSGQMYQPAERVPRDNFGIVGPFMLSTGLRLQDSIILSIPARVGPSRCVCPADLRQDGMMSQDVDAILPILA